MTTRTLALMFFMLVAAHGTRNVQAETKTTDRTLKWEAAVKPDVPAIPPQQKVATVAEESASKSSLPLFYSTQKIVPPLPFNPFPELDLFDLGDNKFAYDDRAVDYQGLSATTAVMTSFSAEELDGPLLGPLMCSSSNDLSLNITSTNTSDFLLDVCNTTPGVLYGIGAKSVLDIDPFNTWTLVNVFEAQSTNEQLVGTASAPTRFYTAVNLDEYVGPIVSIVSPTSGTVTGAVALQVRVTDILPLTSLKVFVGGVQVGVIVPGQNGTMSVPTYLFPNGDHEIWVAAANEGVLFDTDGDGAGDEVVPFNGWASTTLNFTNDVYMENYSPLYSAGGSITLQYTATSPQDYTFEVFNLSGNLLHTASGQSTNGAINGEWNFTDLLTNPVTDSGYVFSLATSPQSGGPTNKMLTTNFFDNGGVRVGKYVISYGTWPSSDLNTGLASLNRSVSIRVNRAAQLYDDIVGTGRDAYGVNHIDFSSDPFPIRLASQTNDLIALTNAKRFGCRVVVLRRA